MSKKKILVIDDDEIHLQTAQEILQHEGYEVIAHLGPFGATERVWREEPDLVLVDVNMPALSGEGLVSVFKKRERTSKVPLFLFSSNDEEALRDSVERLGVAGYVCKGDPQELRQKVAAQLRAAE